jgi:hypothetical protein
MEWKQRLAARVGVFGVGLAAYWPQFPGLRERLVGYQRDVEAHLAGRAAGERFVREDLDLLVCSIGHIRYIVAGAPRRAAAARPGARPQPTTRRRAGL